MNHIDQLNRKLGSGLGYVRSGAEPRFAWKWGPDLPYWRSRLGKVWVLCQWQRPAMSEQEWTRQLGARLPYPAAGMYHPHTETALTPGQLPTEALTQNYIWALDRQMSISLEQQLIAVKDDLAADEKRNYGHWVEYVQDGNSAFSNPAPGTRGGHVSYGGI